MNRHLTDEQFTDLLLGLDDGTAAAHLNSCEHCRQEMTRVEETMGMLREASMDWSRQRVAEMPTPQPGFFERLGLSFRPAAGMAMAAVLAIAVAVPFLIRDNDAPQQASVQHKSPVPTAEQIAADNELMSAINQEIAQPAAQHEAAFANESGKARTTKR
ncbi:hypothetical protein AB4Y89_07980 [Terriglobus sp. 2YAB30_2]|uniref:hypothetical protein n=1 Tax=unclassified Terriglobus TaxID=2628988 RepID=UPI003F9ACDDA